MKVNQLVNIMRENTIKENIEPMESYMRKQFYFLGIKSKKRSEISKEYLKENRDRINWEDVFFLWDLDEREFQYVAIDYLKSMKRKISGEDLDILKTLILKKSWWDTVDALSTLVGEAVLKLENGKELMLEWADDENFWIRRASILHQLKFKNKTDENLLETIILKNFGSDEFFINKAIGWLLRQYSKTNPIYVEIFINKYRDKMSSLSIREGSKYI